MMNHPVMNSTNSFIQNYTLAKHENKQTKQPMKGLEKLGFFDYISTIPSPCLM